MTEEIFASVKANPHVQPDLLVWGPEITVYFVLNGLTAGAMILAGAVLLSGREDRAPFAAWRLPLIGFVAINVAMMALTADLERIPMAWRFFTAIEMTSSMSRGTWALMVVIPMLALLTLATLRRGYPPLARLLERIPLVGRLVTWVIDITFAWRRLIAFACILLGIDLGLHTGVMLASISARPFWHSPLMPPLMLSAGLAAGAAAVLLATAWREERRLFATILAAVVVAQLVLTALHVELMHSGTAIEQAAIHHVLGGEATEAFWLGIVGLGLILPLLLLVLTIWRPSLRWLAMIAPVLVVVGFAAFAHLTLTLGQEIGGTEIANQFDPGLLDLLTNRKDATHAE